MILFFVGCIQLFFVGSRMGVPHLGFVFFVWVGIFSLTTIAQFWSYANEIYTRAGRRPAVPADRGRLGGGRSAGRARSPSWLFALGMSPFVMMQIAAGMLLAPPRAVPGRQPARQRGPGAAGRRPR